MYVEEWGLNSVTAFETIFHCTILVPFSQIAFSVLLHLWDIQIASKYLLHPSTVKPAFCVFEGTHLYWTYSQRTYEIKEMKTGAVVEIK
jgi:hypothetical protein